MAGSLVDSVAKKIDVILTASQGFERSRFLINCALHSLIEPSRKFTRFVHVHNKDYAIQRIYDEVGHLPFGEFDLKRAKLFGSDSDTYKSDSIQSVCSTAQLIVCHFNHVFGEHFRDCLKDSVLLFDGIPLASIERKCFDLWDQQHPGEKCSSSGLIFKNLRKSCWSVVIACNAPVDFLVPELALHPETIIIDQDQFKRPQYRTNSTVLLQTPEGFKFEFHPDKRHPDIHSHVGAVLESSSNKIKSGGIALFFPNYGTMVQYHCAWKKSGLFERMGIPYARENRAGDHFKNGLRDFATQEKSIFMFSIRYHQDEQLAEFALSKASVVIVVGVTDIDVDNYELRSDELSTPKLWKNRILEFLNGVLKRCVSETRYTDCSFIVLDCNIGDVSSNIAPELSNDKAIV